MNKLAASLLLLAVCVAAQASALGGSARSPDQLRLPSPSRKLLQDAQSTMAIATSIAKAIASGDSTAAAAAIANASSQGPAGVAAVAQAVAVSIAAGLYLLSAVRQAQPCLAVQLQQQQKLWHKSTTTWCNEQAHAGRAPCAWV